MINTTVMTTLNLICLRKKIAEDLKQKKKKTHKNKARASDALCTV